MDDDRCPLFDSRPCDAVVVSRGNVQNAKSLVYGCSDLPSSSMDKSRFFFPDQSSIQTAGYMVVSTVYLWLLWQKPAGSWSIITPVKFTQSVTCLNCFCSIYLKAAISTIISSNDSINNSGDCYNWMPAFGQMYQQIGFHCGCPVQTLTVCPWHWSHMAHLVSPFRRTNARLG